MTQPEKLRVADFGGSVEGIENSSGHSMYKDISIDWSRPRIWERYEPAPVEEFERGRSYLYVLLRNHGRSNSKDRIAYVGITKNLNTRFANHPVARKLANMRGETKLSVGEVDFGPYHHKRGTRPSIEQIEHLLIWALGPTENTRKNFTLPGMGANAGRAWHLKNTGYRFSGQMPLEIVYPWMLIKPGRNRAAKS
ncbi:hypothetical protein [Tepidicaulis sp.]|uniref:hypothetical protein n=1 Tax=Tepidicaulis sp. TaxID=1920809 RepID=UPI003B5B3CE5